MKNKLEIYFWTVIGLMVVAVVLSEDAMWWIGLCCCLMAPWAVVAGIAAWKRCCKDDLDDCDGYDDEETL